MSNFIKEIATREASRAKILIDGTSGSGKTWTSLLLGEVLGNSTLVFDSENKSSTKYSTRFKFNVVKMPDYSPKTYSEAIEYGETQPESVLIFDSISHSWAGEGGALELAEQNKVRVGGNKWAAWAHVTPDLNILTHKILDCTKHLICTARVKTDWEESVDGGKKKYTKVGLATVARQEFDFEFDLHFRMQAEGQDHYLVVLKSRYEELKVGELVKNPDKQFAQRLAKIISIGISEEAAEKKRALAYYETLAQKAIDLKIQFPHFTEESDIETIKASGKKLRDNITNAEKKKSSVDKSPKPSKATPEAPEALEAPRTPEALEAPRAPEALEAPRAPEALEAPRAPEALEAPRAQEFSKPLFESDLRGAPVSSTKRLVNTSPTAPTAPAASTPPADVRAALTMARNIADLETIAAQIGKTVIFAARLKQVLKAEGIESPDQIKPSRLNTIVGALSSYLFDLIPKTKRR